VDQALAERRKGNFEGAVLEFQRHLKSEPGDAGAWYELGLTYASDAQYAKAADAYRLALSQGFKEPQCHCALALSLRESGNPMASLNEAQRCRDLMPGYAGAWNLIGNAKIDLEDASGALAAYDKAVALSPEYVNAHYNRGVALQALIRHAEAEAAFQQALKLSPALAEAWDGLGESQLRLGRPLAALKSFGTALKISPGRAGAEWGMARAARALGNARAARKHERAYKRLLRDADNRRMLAAGARERKEAAKRAGEVEAWDREAREAR
jgi:tetratricopeptide (TPR) repeat protein